LIKIHYNQSVQEFIRSGFLMVYYLPRTFLTSPQFTPTKKITEERMASLATEDHAELLPEERKLLQHVICLNEYSIAFSEDERGTFKNTYFTDYLIPWM